MIKTTLISHACLLIQTKNLTIITDPVLFDPHWEDINVICPSRQLQLDMFPQVDVLYLSHRHQDHFDIHTLAYLRNANILAPDFTFIAPKDDLLLEMLKELDYAKIEISRDFEPIQVKDVTLIPTPSDNREEYPEHGLLVRDGEVTVWNQVDSVVSPEVIRYIHQLCGQVDFAHVRFEPLLEGNFTFHQSLKLPFEEYSSFLKVLQALNPKFAVPGSAGFRYCDAFGFLNHYSFPTSQEQFVKDVSEYCPEIQASLFYPGDVAEISSRGIKIIKQSSDFVRVVENNGHLLEFKPVAEVPPIRSLAPDPATHERQMQVVNDFLRSEMLDRLRQHKMLEIWTHWKVVYQLEIFGLEGSEVWTLDFAQGLKFNKGRTGKINLYEGISSSELYRLIQNETNWDFVGASAQYRTFHNIYRIERGSFEYYPQENKFPQPLMECFPSNKDTDREKFMKDVRRWKNKC